MLVMAALTGCGTPVVYRPDTEQVRRVEPPLALPADRKASLEVRTDTFEITRFWQRSEYCGPAIPESGMVLERGRELTSEEVFANNAAAVMTLGLTTMLLQTADNPSYPQSIKREIPSDEPMLWAARSSFSGVGGSRVWCGPVFVKFTAAPTKDYRMDYARYPNSCAVMLFETVDGVPIAVPEHERWSCKRGFMDFTDGVVSDMRKIERLELKGAAK